MIKKKLILGLSNLIKISAILLIFSFKSYADDSKTSNELISLGPEDAEVKIKVLSSFTCPHCANFHFKVIPDIIKEYVERGKVQLIFIDFPLDLAAFNASKILQCVDKKKQITFMDTIYKNQSEWTQGPTIEIINENLKKIVKDLGISSDLFDTCLIDEDISDKILNGRIGANKKYSVNSTPTIIINEKKLEGSVTFENIKKKIEKII
ncbi:thioredoxin domain-containing protein [Pelagibacteraceae bacterium]|jgi:protein-disulfide isomerase|nr:thioredoxin domain-containing protein [Pelagibacteraceae bacterium]